MPLDADGFSLLEVVVALAVVAIACAALAPVLIACATLMADARADTYAVALASTRLEQLSALVYEERAGPPGDVVDTTANLSVDPADDTGDGLRALGPESVWRDTGTRFDRATVCGRWAPLSSPDAWFVRRWAVTDLPGADALFLQVLVHSRAREAAGSARGDARHRPGDVWLFTIRAKEAR